MIEKEIKFGRLKGRMCRVDDTVKIGPGDLPFLSCEGNMAARNAINIDGFKVENEPFIYVKVDSLGYIIPKSYIE